MYGNLHRYRLTLAWPFQSDLLRKSGSFQAASAAFPAVIIIGSCSECFLLYKRRGIFSEAAKVWIFQKKMDDSTKFVTQGMWMTVQLGF